MKLTLIALSMIACVYWNSFTQTIYNNGQISIAANTKVTVSGDIRNFGWLANNGRITLDGDWINHGEYVDDNGTVILNGYETQTVDHNNYSFGTLRIEGGDKTVESNFVIADELQLDQGLIFPQSNVVIRIASGGGITGASSSSFINGPLTHEGEGNKFYPIGKNRNYLPAELLDITGSQPVITMEVFEPNPNPGLVDGLLWVSENRYWQRTIESGTVESALITLYYQHENLINVPDNLVVVESDTEHRVFESLGCRYFQGSRIEGSITSRNFIGEDIYTIAELDDLISISNVITPNNDNVNDYLYIANIEEYPDNEIIILNRLGNKLYSASSYQNNWDATVDGRKLPNGHYICIVKIAGYPNAFRQIVTVLN